MTELEALISLNMAGGIGTIGLRKLLGYFGKPQNIFKAPKEKIMRACGIGEAVARKISVFNPEALNKEFCAARKNNIKIITQASPDYPENLKNIPDPALVLYVKGQLRGADNIALAIVGSRRASFYGLSCAEKFAQGLAGLGLTVVSGLARGIDTYAHRGALKAGGRTVAVLGSGFNHFYPPENQELAQEISRNGAVISEFPFDTEPLRQNFPRRNRIISGLSLGVLVAEAAKNSGALITADFALEQGRDVFALPGKIDSGTSSGTNSLIKEGAKLVSCIEDVLEGLNLAAQAAPRSSIKKDDIKQALNDKESFLYRIIRETPLALDEIVEKSDMGVAALSDTLLTLEMKRLIRQLPGKQFIRKRA